MIIRASEELFRLRGVKTVSLEEVADKVGISRGTIYNHFTNKELLLRAILEPFFQKLDQDFSQVEQNEELSFEDVADLLYRLWIHHKRVWEMIQHPDMREFSELASSHQEFINRFQCLVQRFPEDYLVDSDHVLTSRLILAVFRPMMTVYEGHERQKILFTNSLRALLMFKTRGN